MTLVANAFPAKSFFVTMLTRDIELADAILDLLDNCVDGIIRTKWSNDDPNSVSKPYEGYKAEIELSGDFFRIKDNCGGIPREIAEKYAFVMGRKDQRDSNLPTVGMYGIGMKRALFKMGAYSKVTSQTDEATFEVEITPDWLKSDENWELPIVLIDKTTEDNGTTIEVSQLYDGISSSFSNRDGFVDTFRDMVAKHYSFIINKGFSIEINGVKVNPVPMQLLLEIDGDRESLSPYIYEANIDGVSVLLEVGLYRPTPSEDELDEEQVMKRTKDDSGWTIICNDRVVLYKDKSILTGWGEANVPSFHNQFIGISGIVIFKSNNAALLPLTTTKRGIEASSELYLKVKNHMRIGTKLFTDYTNKWKKDPEKERETSGRATLINVLQLPSQINVEKWKTISVDKSVSVEETTTADSIKGSESRTFERYFAPKLPKPQDTNQRIQIRFTRDKNEIRRVAEHLFDDPDKSPVDVGVECFERVLRSLQP